MDLYNLGSLSLDISIEILVLGTIIQFILAFTYFKRNGSRTLTDAQKKIWEKPLYQQQSLACYLALRHWSCSWIVESGKSESNSEFNSPNPMSSKSIVSPRYLSIMAAILSAMLGIGSMPRTHGSLLAVNGCTNDIENGLWTTLCCKIRDHSFAFIASYKYRARLFEGDRKVVANAFL